MPSAAILLYAAGLAWLCIWRTRIRLAGLLPIAAALLLYAAVRPPDILISPDSRLIAVRGPAGALLYRAPKASAFTLGQWSDVWPRTQLTSYDPTACTGESCTIAPNVALLLTATAACPPAQVILSPIPLRGLCDGSGALVLDRLSTYQNGAIAIWLRGKQPRQLTDRMVQGSRPWIPPWPAS